MHTYLETAPSDRPCGWWYTGRSYQQPPCEHDRECLALASEVEHIRSFAAARAAYDRWRST